MFAENSEIVLIMLEDIRRDGGTQPRVAIDWKHVKVLEDQMLSGAKLEPVIVFQDSDGEYWLADGFHRWYAHKNQLEDFIACVVYQGSLRDAVLYSVGANADSKPAILETRKISEKQL